MNKNNLILIVACIAAVLGYFFGKTKHEEKPAANSVNAPSEIVATQSPQQSSNGSQIHTAFLQHKSNVQVQGTGVVKAILKDDLDGSRHQKFILTIQNGMTVLVAHNIDLAPRLNGLQKGDRAEFNGEYEYNEKGGVLHWTHKDPSQRHADGWLKWNGKMYQ